MPTMGNLHAGHLQLVEQAAQLADRVVATIFVNPSQFGAGEDLEAYPRTLQQDTDRLAALGTSLLFAPPESAIYLRDDGRETRVEVTGISNMLCGVSRPTHFAGVATVVCKLLNIVQPDVAVFGQKDFQQLLVIRRMVEDLFIPVEIVGAATVREPDGLAMSSRNGYLTAEERALAPVLFRELGRVGAALRAGNLDYHQLEQQAANAIRVAGMRPDYVQIRTADDLSQPQPDSRELVILVAAYLGRARLIDNLVVNLD